MNIIKNKLSKKINTFNVTCLVSSLLLWVVAIANIYELPFMAGIRVSMAFALHISTILIILYFILVEKYSRTYLIKWFLFLNCWLLLVDFLFYIAVYTTNKLVINLSFLNFLLYYAPCIIYCLFTTFFIGSLLLRHVFSVKALVRVISSFLLMNIVVIALFLSSIHYAFKVVSWEVVSQIALLTTELILFDFAILALIYARNMSAILFLSGVINLICGDFFITYSYISQTLHLFSYGSLLWVMGLLLIFLSVVGLFYFKQYHTTRWFRKKTAIKSQLTLWCFSLSSGSFLLFFVLSYIFSALDKSIFIKVPLFIMIYSMIVIVSSIVMGEALESPFKNIKRNIQDMLRSQQPRIANVSDINEFKSLQNFITTMLTLRDQKTQKIHEVNKRAQETVNELSRSLQSLNEIFSETVAFSGQQKFLFERCSHGLVNTVSKLINTIQEGKSYCEIINSCKQPVMIAALLKDIVLEKQLQFSNINLSIIENFSLESLHLFAEINVDAMKNVLSNIVNNSIEARADNTIEITIKLYAENDVIILSITDNGMGINKSDLEKILLTGISLKTTGHGLGLSHAKEVIKSFSGTLKIESQEKVGTEVTITLPRPPSPAWFPAKISIPKEVNIAILDSGDVLSPLKETLLKKFDVHSVFYFTNAEELFRWYETQEKPITLFSMHELEDSFLTGLDVIERLGLSSNAVIITAYHDDNTITERLTALKSFMWPLNLLEKILQTVDENSFEYI